MRFWSLWNLIKLSLLFKQRMIKVCRNWKKSKNYSWQNAKLTIFGHVDRVLITTVAFEHHSTATGAPSWNFIHISHFRNKLAQVLYINMRMLSQRIARMQACQTYSCDVVTFTFIWQIAVISIGIHAIWNFAWGKRRIYPCGFHIGFKFFTCKFATFSNLRCLVWKHGQICHRAILANASSMISLWL